MTRVLRILKVCTCRRDYIPSRNYNLQSSESSINVVDRGLQRDWFHHVTWPWTPPTPPAPTSGPSSSFVRLVLHVFSLFLIVNARLTFCGQHTSTNGARVVHFKPFLHTMRMKTVLAHGQFGGHFIPHREIFRTNATCFVTQLIHGRCHARWTDFHVRTVALQYFTIHDRTNGHFASRWHVWFVIFHRLTQGHV